MSISSLDALFSTIVESWSVSNMGLLPPDTPEQWASILPFLAFFATIYLLVLSLNKAVFNLRRDTCLLISTCAMSFVHGILCVIASVPNLWNWERFQFDLPNTSFQNKLMQFSFAYLTADSIHMIFFDRNVLFFAHHILSLLYLYAVLRLQVGAMSAVFVFFMGELTSPLVNAFYVLRALRKDYSWANRGFSVVAPVFTGSFILVRSIIAPPLMVWYAWKMVARSEKIPFAWRIFMASLVFLGMLGSQIWSYKSLQGYKNSLLKKPKST